jgi:hypothetical protein
MAQDEGPESKPQYQEKQNRFMNSYEYEVGCHVERGFK